MTKTIPLTKGQVAVIDDEDFALISQWKWCITGQYAGRRAHEGPGGFVYMHRLIANAPAGMFVDHINRNTLDNRRANLRIVTSAENTYNKGTRNVPKTSRFRGVAWDKKRGAWGVYIKAQRLSRFVGYFDDETEAARAYDRAARAQFGELAAPNFPVGD